MLASLLLQERIKLELGGIMATKKEIEKIVEAGVVEVEKVGEIPEEVKKIQAEANRQYAIHSLNLYQKINEVKKVVKTFTKDAKTEGSGSYTYISGTQILSAIKEKMEELQLLLLPVATEHQHHETYNYTTRSGQKTDFIVIGKITYEWINAENPEERQRVDWQYYGQQNDISKAFGSGLTYSERYLLLKSLGAPTDEDDPDATNELKTQAKNTTPAQPKAPAKKSKYQQAEEIAKANNFTMAQVSEWIKKKYKKYSVNGLTDEQFDELVSALESGGKNE